MKAIKLVIIPLLVLLSACSTTYEADSDYNSAYNFKAVDSFYVVGDEQYKNPYLSDMNRDRINDSISAELSKLHLDVQNKTSADVLISYFVVTKEKIKVTSTPVTYSRYGTYGQSHINTRDYVEGTIIIDVVDNKSQKSIWRSSIQKSVKELDTPEERSQEIAKVVKALFAGFPTQQI
ncbi:DUF4136 domain-containing protein [Thalassotalea psychrophila]|uniref:DUF4136 domain-containing protein n=1 Tax=Thalassotalea psychrophila TaxID=3065647 RepID=A0ABY9TYF8_9GAMM|nr:DUF4136 domain-containing protein [Colwelliaceae bacterium SQ149]